MNKVEWIAFLKERSREIGGEAKETAFDRLNEMSLGITMGWTAIHYPELFHEFEGQATAEKKPLSEKAQAMYDKVVNHSQFGEHTEGLLEVLGLLIGEDIVSQFKETRQQNRQRDYLELTFGLMIVPLGASMNHNYELNRPALVIDSDFNQNKGYRLSYDRGTVGDRQIGVVKGLGNHLPVIRSAIRPAFPTEIKAYFDQLKEELTPEDVLEIVGKLGG